MLIKKSSTATDKEIKVTFSIIGSNLPPAAPLARSARCFIPRVLLDTPGVSLALFVFLVFSIG